MILAFADADGEVGEIHPDGSVAYDGSLSVQEFIEDVVGAAPEAQDVADATPDRDGVEPDVGQFNALIPELHDAFELEAVWVVDEHRWAGD